MFDTSGSGSDGASAVAGARGGVDGGVSGDARRGRALLDGGLARPGALIRAQLEQDEGKVPSLAAGLDVLAVTGPAKGEEKVGQEQ